MVYPLTDYTNWFVLNCPQTVRQYLSKKYKEVSRLIRGSQSLNIYKTMYKYKISLILCLWFRASLIYINNCPTRCNTKQSPYYSACSLYMFRVSTTRQPTWPSLATLEGGSCTKNVTITGGSSCSFVYPDYGCDWHLKHVEWTCRIINRLLCAASRWTIINIDQRCTEP